MRAKTGISERRACVLMGLSRTVLRYEGRGERDCGVLRSRILLLAAQRRRFGYRRIHALIRREGLAVNCKRVQRIYCEERLQVTRRKRRRGGRAPRARGAAGAERGVVHRLRQRQPRAREAAQVLDDRR
jgi:putative transposase